MYHFQVSGMTLPGIEPRFTAHKTIILPLGHRHGPIFNRRKQFRNTNTIEAFLKFRRYPVFNSIFKVTSIMKWFIQHVYWPTVLTIVISAAQVSQNCLWLIVDCIWCLCIWLHCSKWLICEARWLRTGFLSLDTSTFVIVFLFAWFLFRWKRNVDNTGVAIIASFVTCPLIYQKDLKTYFLAIASYLVMSKYTTSKDIEISLKDFW